MQLSIKIPHPAKERSMKCNDLIPLVRFHMIWRKLSLIISTSVDMCPPTYLPHIKEIVNEGNNTKVIYNDINYYYLDTTNF